MNGTDTRTKAEIERELESERAKLAASLEMLQHRFSVEGMARQFVDQASRHGGEFAQSLTRAAKENPVALALTGIGLAWMMYGDSARSRIYASTLPRADEMGDARFTRGNEDGSGILRSAADAAREVSHRWDRMSSGAGEYARSTRATAEDLRERLYEGTSQMTEAARQRVVNARDAAYRAQRELERAAAHAKRGSVDLFNEQPLVAGALALAAGAILGAALPRTRMEDEAVGEYSDRLLEEAERVFREETEKVGKVAEAAKSEVETAAREMKAKADERAPQGQTAAGAAKSEAASAAGKITDAAKAEASKQGVAKPKI
jgi:hypothetical protein